MTSKCNRCGNAARYLLNGKKWCDECFTEYTHGAIDGVEHDASFAVTIPTKAGKRRTRIRPVSKRRAVELREYHYLRRIYLQAFPKCQACDESPSEDIHHIRGKSGRMLNNQEHWLAVCRHCHDWIHRHPLAAAARGLFAKKGEWLKGAP